MIGAIRNHLIAIVLGCSLALAAMSGVLVSQALGGSLAGPAKTVTINVPTGTTGPPGPAGPAGPAGPKGDPGTPGDVATCPSGFTAGLLVINHSAGQVAVWACLRD